MRQVTGETKMEKKNVRGKKEVINGYNYNSCHYITVIIIK